MDGFWIHFQCKRYGNTDVHGHPQVSITRIRDVYFASAFQRPESRTKTYDKIWQIFLNGSNRSEIDFFEVLNLAVCGPMWNVKYMNSNAYNYLHGTYFKARRLRIVFIECISNLPQKKNFFLCTVTVTKTVNIIKIPFPEFQYGKNVKTHSCCFFIVRKKKR